MFDFLEKIITKKKTINYTMSDNFSDVFITERYILATDGNRIHYIKNDKNIKTGYLHDRGENEIRQFPEESVIEIIEKFSDLNDKKAINFILNKISNEDLKFLKSLGDFLKIPGKKIKNNVHPITLSLSGDKLKITSSYKNNLKLEFYLDGVDVKFYNEFKEEDFKFNVNLLYFLDALETSKTSIGYQFLYIADGTMLNIINPSGNSAVIAAMG